MTAAQRAKIQKLLLALARGLSGKPLRKLDPNRTSEAEVGGDEDEQPLNEMLQAIASDRNRNDARLVAMVDRAIGRLRETPEELGLCLECGEEIAFGRLTAMPYAELCVDCQTRRDGPKSGPTRRKLTEYK
ncbi:MAG: TraR/DksA family transcriptional regulator [Myxococcota bacterium]